MPDTKDETKQEPRATATDRTTTAAAVGAGSARDGEAALFDANSVNAQPLTPTAEDALGVERITGPAVDGWTPSPIDPAPEQVEAAQKREQLFEEQRQRRLGALVNNENKLPNNPADAGSQS